MEVVFRGLEFPCICGSRKKEMRVVQHGAPCATDRLKGMAMDCTGRGGGVVKRETHRLWARQHYTPDSPSEASCCDPHRKMSG